MKRCYDSRVNPAHLKRSRSCCVVNPNTSPGCMPRSRWSASHGARSQCQILDVRGVSMVIDDATAGTKQTAAFVQDRRRDWECD